MKKIAIIAAWALLAASAACSDPAPPAQPPPPPPPPPAPPPGAPAPSVPGAAGITLPEPTTAEILSDATQADTIAVAEVVVLGPAPGPGGEPCRPQGATYRVVESLRGADVGQELRVAHSICLGRPWVDNKRFGLSPALLAPGKRFVLFLRHDPTGRAQYAGESGPWTSEYQAFDERSGVLAADDAVLADVRKAVAATGGSAAPPAAPAAPMMGTGAPAGKAPPPGSPR